MTRDDAKQEIKRGYARILPLMTNRGRSRTNGDTVWICPLCGGGKAGDGIARNPKARDGYSLICYGKGCAFSGDVVDLYGQTMGMDYDTALDRLEDMLMGKMESWATQGEDGKPDETKDIPAVSPPDGWGTSAKDGLFGIDYLYEGDSPVFIVEGLADAVAIVGTGRRAISLDNASNATKLIDIIKTCQEYEKPITAAVLIVVFSRDSVGDLWTQELTKGLEALGIRAIDGRAICGDHVSIKDARTTDNAAFGAALASILDNADKQSRKQVRPDNVSEYIANGGMDADIEKGRGGYKTGFRNLDTKTKGLFPGLYVLAAIPSLGKTTLAHQMADQLATRGTEVLFFSLEQSRLELVSKSINRQMSLDYMAKSDTESPADFKPEITSLNIRCGIKTPAVKRALGGYTTAVGDRLSIIEANFGFTVDTICDYVRDYANTTRTTPVVMVDYLQVLQPPMSAQRQTAREMVDITVVALKRLSRDLSVPVLLISSLNRNNYNAVFDFESLKESGGIEYTADVVWGLQLQCLHDPIFEKETGIKAKRDKIRLAKMENPRKVELVCVKNRFGESSFTCYFDYYPSRDILVETGEPRTTTAPKGT